MGVGSMCVGYGRILLMPDSAASLLSSPGVCLARLSSGLQMTSPDNISFAVWRKFWSFQKQQHFTAILTCLSKDCCTGIEEGQLAQTGTPLTTGRGASRELSWSLSVPGAGKSHPRHGRLFSESLCAGLEEVLVQLPWACGVLCTPKAESSRQGSTCAVVWFHLPP